MNKFFKLLFFLVLYCCSIALQAQDNFLKKSITINTSGKSLENILMEISDQAGFTFSYNTSILSADPSLAIHAKNESVKSTLDKILPQNVEYKISGNHMILLKKKPNIDNSKKEKYKITGSVLNATDNEPLSGIIVYEVSTLISSVTDHDGKFSIVLPDHFEHLSLSFNNRDFSDTIIFITPRDQNITISLSPAKKIIPAERISSLPVTKMAVVESLPIVKRLVPAQAFVRVNNMDRIRQKTAQISFLPALGTNLKMSGLIENKYSLNVLAGYSYGLKGFELGGIINIVRKDVDGVQVGGIGNIVGKNTKGFQMGGIFNHNRGNFLGTQVAGINNTIEDTLIGVQVGGINNFVRYEMEGVQVAGINNLALRTTNGVQLAGITNISNEGGDLVQIAGIANHTKNIKGIQFAGIVNHTSKNMTGKQLAGIMNVGYRINGAQFAGIINIARESVSGMQLSGILNYARKVNDLQVGLVNLADSSSGLPIGLFSFVKSGYFTPELYSTEISTGNLALKTGVKRFYNIFSAGLGDWNTSKRWMFGYGFGSEIPLGERFNFTIQYTANWVNEDEKFQKDLSLLNKVDLNLTYRRNNGVAFTAGPSVNFWLSEWKDPETDIFLTQLAPYTIYSNTLGSTLSQMWVGAKVGIHF